MAERLPGLIRAGGAAALLLSVAGGGWWLVLTSPKVTAQEQPPLLPPPPVESEPPLRLQTPPLQDRPGAARFDVNLDDLVNDRVVSPLERDLRRNPARLQPIDVPAHQQACRRGALSEEECRTRFVVRGRGGSMPGDGLADSATPLRLGPDGKPLPGSVAAGPPLPPLTVPVSALLAGPDGSFRLEDVFAVTPRPAPILGNGNRTLLFPLIGWAQTSSSFGYRLHPILGIWRLHAGQDLAAPEGTPVVAALSGRVSSSGLAGGYGLAVELEHASPRRRTLYGHLSELYVRPGQFVRQGEVIGRVGSTGLSTGPHLHFELRLPRDGGWVAVDPGDLDPGSGPAGAPGSDAIALLMGQLLETLERPRPAG